MKKIIESIFNYVYPVLRPSKIQKLLRFFGFKFPYMRFAEKLDYRGIVDFNVNGRKILLKSDNKPIEIFIFWYGIFGYWEKTQLKLWSNLIKKANTILDVGSNTGVYALIASTNKDAKIYAFEPVPAVREQLLENIKLNKVTNVEVIPKLVGDLIGIETLYVPRRGWVDVASLDKSFAKRFEHEGEMYELEMEMTTLDNYVKSLSVPDSDVLLFKIDVEGAESRVLSGMKCLLERGNIMFTMELLDVNYFNSIVTKLPDNYKVFAIDDSNNSVYQTDCFIITASNYLITDIVKEDNIII